MNRKQIVLGLVLADFSALTAYAVWQHGFVGVFQLALASWATGLVFVDLVIALGLVLIWMMGDSRERGLAFLPYAAAHARLRLGGTAALSDPARGSQRAGRAPGARRAGGVTRRATP